MSLAAAAIGLLGSIYSGVQSSRANKEYDEMLSSRMNDLTSRFEREYNQNFLDTDQARSVIKLLNKQFNEQMKKQEGRAAVTGASPEAKIAAKESTQGKFDTALTQLAGYGTQWKDLLQRRFDRKEENLFGLNLSNQGMKQQNWMNLMNNFGNVGSAGVTAGALNDEGILTGLAGLFGGGGSAYDPAGVWKG